ncbi:uncharacterized protein LOC119398809 [Rhipicephalus sanguineus]|uniref:uncharacterized protein LOC119398809 n=1 Tax=Rhipicephalus sanguineus TaxID=34632 RepID=UPI001893537E|nr:uncharacterized protein LOC119398809 [Rhipicephalus sanguineus]
MPLTVTCTLYRAFTKVLKDWVYGWAEFRGLLTELQNGFRKGRRLEDNLFVLTQCAEIARKENRGLLCCFLDVEKAYDNVPHASLFKCLSDLGLPEALQSTIKQLYSGNAVTAAFAGVTTESVEVSKGLRLGCPLSPILYLLYVSELERAIVKSSRGFSLKFSTTGIDENRKIPGLAFADDIVLMAENPRYMQVLLNICAAEIEKLGLRYNAKKTTVVQLVGVAPGCLIVQVPRSDAAFRGDIYGQHEEIIRRIALRAQCVLRRRSLCVFNRYLMVQDMWKLVHVPALTFCNATVCLSLVTREWLERRQREVGRTALGSHGAVANEAVQGDLWWSTFEAREAASQLTYRGGMQFMLKERLARQVFEYLAATCMRTDWTNRIYRLEKKYGFFTAPIQADTMRQYVKAVRDRVQETEEELWLQEMSGKTSVTLYGQHKRAISAVSIYNSLGSRLLFEAVLGHCAHWNASGLLTGLRLRAQADGSKCAGKI